MGISVRQSGVVDKDGFVTVTKILSYDIVSNPSFSGAFIFNRSTIIKNWKDKINKL